MAAIKWSPEFLVNFGSSSASPKKSFSSEESGSGQNDRDGRPLVSGEAYIFAYLYDFRRRDCPQNLFI